MVEAKCQRNITTLNVEAMSTKVAKQKAFLELQKIHGKNSFIVLKLEGKRLRQPQIRSSCSTSVNKINGAKKFVTDFELHVKLETGETHICKETYKTETEAVKDAKKIAVKYQAPVHIVCTKKWVNSKNGDAVTKIISPRNPVPGKWEMIFTCIVKENMSKIIDKKTDEIRKSKKKK